MMMGRTGSAALWLTAVIVAALLTCTVCRNPVKHIVGGRDQWKPNVNYTTWSLHETFYVGDWLYFGYDKHLFNVLEVNKTSYENCNEQGFIFNLTRGAGRDVFQLTEPKPYYFLASGGYCYNGMRVAVDVIESVPAPQPSPAAKNGCSTIKGGLNYILVSSIMLAVWAALNL